MKPAEDRMANSLSRHFSERAKLLRASEVRELLKLLNVPDMISFAGGFPNPETFPGELVRKIADEILKTDAAQTLQYGITEGYGPLREVIADRMNKKRMMKVSKDNVVVVSGSQQVIDLVGKVFIDPGDVIVISAPTYLTALTGFAIYEPTFETIPLDADNMRLDIFEERMKQLSKRASPPELVYVLPNFHNPAGVTMPEKNRRRLLDLASDYDFIILEDDPYCELRYVGDHVRPIKSFDDVGRVIYMSTFSKVLSPGLRVGWVVADQEVLSKMIIAKQSADVCTNVLGQRIAHEYVANGFIDPQIEKIRKIYSRKLKLMLSGMDEFMPEGVKWEKPQGGMFLWATLPNELDSSELLKSALKRRVAFVTGKAFYPDPKDGTRNMRLNFTHPSDDMITEGLRRLGAVVNQEIVSRWDQPRGADEQRLDAAAKGGLIGKS